MRFLRNKPILTALFAMLVVFTSSAQFASGPRIGNVATIPSGGYVMDSHHLAGTNLASPSPFALTGNELKFYIDWGATNATTGVSNMVFNFQISADGSKWLDGDAPGAPTLSFTLLGPGAGGQTYTNLLTAATVSGFRFIRLHSITNDHIGAASNTFYITNAWFSQF